MEKFKEFALDKEKDIVITLYKQGEDMYYALSTPNHTTGNLIRNFAKLCHLPLSKNKDGLFVIRGQVPCFINGNNEKVYIFSLRDITAANIYSDGRIEQRASVPAISKTLMSQTKDYHLSFFKTVVKTFIPAFCKFNSDLHTHMNANLPSDIYIALAIYHQLICPKDFMEKVRLKCTATQEEISFAQLLLKNREDAMTNINRIRTALAVRKDGQAVFTDLEEVYKLRYVFTKGSPVKQKIELSSIDRIPDETIRHVLKQIVIDHSSTYKNNTLYQNLLLWIARHYAAHGIRYVEISDTSLCKAESALTNLSAMHAILPQITKETGVTIRFLAGIRRIALNNEEDREETLSKGLQVLRAIADDPYIAGSDILGEEVNDIRELKPVIKELVSIAKDIPSFVIRIHAGENDCLRDNVANSIEMVLETMEEGQPMPMVRIGHGLYTANLYSKKGKHLLELLHNSHAILEFQITSNVRLNNLSSLAHHPLKQYLHHGVACVQGTDGGALYGTDSIDEQLALERLLDLDEEDLLLMKKTENRVIENGMAALRTKAEQLEQDRHGKPIDLYYREKIEREKEIVIKLDSSAMVETKHVFENTCMNDRIPIVIAGGSFNNDQHVTTMHQEEKAMLDKLIDGVDGEKVCFVVGHTLRGYEKYVVERCGDRIPVIAFVPEELTMQECERLKREGVHVFVSKALRAMELYKGISEEIFKRRRYVLVVLDGNSPANNLIQEAHNGLSRHNIFINGHSRVLQQKAQSLKGYVHVLHSAEDILAILKNAE